MLRFPCFQGGGGAWEPQVSKGKHERNYKKTLVSQSKNKGNHIETSFFQGQHKGNHMETPRFPQVSLG